MSDHAVEKLEGFDSLPEGDKAELRKLERYLHVKRAPEQPIEGAYAAVYGEVVFEECREERTMYQQTPEFTNGNYIVRIIALRFKTECERFDRTLPGCQTHHAEWMPFAGEPMAMSREYARRNMADRIAEAERSGISQSALQKEISDVSRLTFEQQQHELACLLGK